MQKKLWFLILPFITMGCTEKVYVMGPTITKTDTILVAPKQQIVLRVDWNKLAVSTTSKLNDGMVYAMSDSNLSITHIGTRLEYVNNNASFTQSVVKDTGTTSLITLNVPPTESANLYVIAVHERNGVRKALKMGVRRSIRIAANSTINLTLDSLTLIDTDWAVEDPTITIQNDTIIMTANSLSQNKILNIRTVDPYQMGTTFVSYSNRIVKFYGVGFEYGNQNGWRRFGINVLNKEVPVTIDTFWPYIDGSLFNLNNDYLIGKQGIIKTTWQ